MSDNPATSESQVRVFQHDISIRGLIVILLAGTACGMSAFGIEIKEPMYTLVVSAVSWYFGQKGKQ